METNGVMQTSSTPAANEERGMTPNNYNHIHPANHATGLS